MNSKLYVLIFCSMVILNCCDCTEGDRCQSRILEKLDEIEQNLSIKMEEKISSLEDKVDRLVDEMQGQCHKNNDTLDCPALVVENAMVTPCSGTITHGSSATVTCAQGYTLVGKSTVTCLEGKYDTIPVCKANCQALDVLNAVVNPPTPVAHGTVVQVVCTGITTLIGGSTVTCLDGIYENIPSCVFDISATAAVYKEDIPIKVKGDRQPPSVFAAEFLPDGRLLVVDNANEKIKLLSRSFTYEGSVRIERPYAVAVINKTTAVVSSYSRTAPQLHFISLIPSLQLLSAIPLEQRCFGIDVYNNTIYVTCHKYNEGQGHVKLLNMDGKLVGTLGVTEHDGWTSYMFQRPVCVRVSRFTGNVCVSDWAAHVVTCLSPKGERIFKFSNTDFIKYPDHFILDDRDNILIVGRGQNIFEIIDNGQNYRILSRNGDGLEYPDTLAYRQADGILLVGGYSSRIMKVYELYSTN